MVQSRGLPLQITVFITGLLACGCQTYEVWQADCWKAPDFHPQEIKRAAFVIPAGPALDRNKTFAEAMIVAIHRRGPRLVEQQLVDAVTRETRLILQKQADLVSTRDLASRIGRELNVDTIFYADATVRSTVFRFTPKLLGAWDDETARRQEAANKRGNLLPDDVRRCNVLVQHSVGLTLRAVDIATGKIKWVGYRYLAMADPYADDRPDVVTSFGGVEKLAQKLTDDVFGANGPASAVD